MNWLVDELINAINVPEPKRSVYADSESLYKIMQLKSDDGQYLWCAGLEPNSQSTILGIPIYRCEEEGIRMRFTFGEVTFEYLI